MAIDTRPTTPLGVTGAAATPARGRRPWIGALAAGMGATAVIGFFLATAHDGVAGDSRIANPSTTTPVGARVFSKGIVRLSPPLWGVTDWPAVFTRLFLIVAIALAVTLLVRSWRAGKVSHSLILFAAVTGLCWIDPLGNWATFTVYDPRFTHFPTSWPWVSLAPAIEPLMALPGYPFYWFLPACFAAWVYRRHVGPRSRPGTVWARHPLIALFGVGFAVGFLFDMAMELFMIRADMYRYSQSWGPVIAWGAVRLPVSAIVLDASVFGTLAALFWRDDAGRSVSERIARRVRLLRRRPVLGQVVVAWAVLSIAAFAFLVPFDLMRLTNGATRVTAPWRYPEIKVYDPDGRWAKAGVPGPYYPGILSLDHAKRSGAR